MVRTLQITYKVAPLLISWARSPLTTVISTITGTYLTDKSTLLMVGGPPCYLFMVLVVDSKSKLIFVASHGLVREGRPLVDPERPTNLLPGEGWLGNGPTKTILKPVETC